MTAKKTDSCLSLMDLEERTREGRPRNDIDPFKPCYFAPKIAAIRDPYEIAVSMLGNLTHQEVSDIRNIIPELMQRGRQTYKEQARGVLLDILQKYDVATMDLVRPYQSRFSPLGYCAQYGTLDNLSTESGAPILDLQIWAVCSIEEICSALSILDPDGLGSTEIDRLWFHSTSNDFPCRAYMHLMNAGLWASRALGGLFVLEIEANTAAKTKRTKGLVALNQKKRDARQKAIDTATSFWRKDDRKALRIGEVADLVYRSLAAEGMADALPESANSVRDWIKHAAPDYARKGGRQAKRKSPPDRNA